MDEQLRAKPKRCVRSACAFGGNTDGVQPFLCAVQSAKWRALVSTLGHFLWTPPLWKACQLNWQREARHFSSPKQTDNCCWYHANNPGSSQTGWTPEEPRVSAVTHTHTHTHTSQSALYLLPPPDPTGSRCPPVTASSDMTHACQNADRSAGIRRWTCAGVSSFSPFLEAAHDNLGLITGD